jgi:integrase
MREGELFGLCWRDVDLDAKRIRVTHALQAGPQGSVIRETKTGRSRRAVMLTESAASALRRHRRPQSEERLWLGPAWAEHDLVFANRTRRS